MIASPENYTYHEIGQRYHLTPQILMGDGVPSAPANSLKSAYIVKRQRERYST